MEYIAKNRIGQPTFEDYERMEVLERLSKRKEFAESFARDIQTIDVGIKISFVIWLSGQIIFESSPAIAKQVAEQCQCTVRHYKDSPVRAI